MENTENAEYSESPGRPEETLDEKHFSEWMGVKEKSTVPGEFPLLRTATFGGRRSAKMSAWRLMARASIFRAQCWF